MSEYTTKKSLGQHWLHDESILQAIVDAAGVQQDDIVLEIGPGKGTLTEQLLEAGATVTALEFDRDLIAPLNKTFKNNANRKKLAIVEGDIRTFDYTQMSKDYKIAANIPYYLTSNLIRAISETSNPPSIAVLLIQKEVAQRLCARPSTSSVDVLTAHQPTSDTSSAQSHSVNYSPSQKKASDVRLEHAQIQKQSKQKVIPGKMGILSVTAQFYFECSLDVEVPAALFTPPPKVDSQVVVLQHRGKPLFDVDEQKFFAFVKAGFSEKRKTLRNSLSGGLGISKDDVVDLLERSDISLTARAQELRLEQWHKLYLAYGKA